jgi:hypothetical protein
MAGESLDPYYVQTQRYSSNLGGREGLRGQVDAYLNELRVPCTLDQDGDWRFQSDVGPFLMVLDRDTQDLVVIQTIQAMERRPKHHADEMHVLLGLNYDAEGARFAAIKDGGKDLLVLTSRLHPDELDGVRFEKLLADCMRLSRRIDELTGAVPPPAAVQPAPGMQPAPGVAQGQYGPMDVPPAGAPMAPQAAEQYEPPQAPATPPEAASQPAPEPPPVAPEPPPQAVAEPPPQAAPEPPPEPQQPAAAPPDWYPDPYGQFRLRYWDGQAWTEHTAQ